MTSYTTDCSLAQRPQKGVDTQRAPWGGKP